MKLKKTYLISFVFMIFVFIACLIYTFIFFNEPSLINSTVKTYKFLTSLKLFFSFVPAAIGTGCLIGWTIDFGNNAQGSLNRFSTAMFARFQQLIITGLVFVFALTAVNEIVLPIINARLRHFQAMPALLKEYNSMAEKLYESERFSLAYDYAKQASEIDSGNKDTKHLLYLTELSLRNQKKITDELKKTTGELTFNEDLSNLSEKNEIIRLHEPFETFALLKAARECYEMHDYFGAHYYADTAVHSADPKDINIRELKELASAAWNQLGSARLEGTTEEQKLFQKKYEGYVRLINGDNLKAYYIFKTLSLQSKKLSIDPDIVRYLAVAEARIEKQYFFSDETFNLQAFESTENVRFKIKKDDGTTDVIFIKGITQTTGAEEMAQYLRGLYIFTLDENNSYKSGMYTAYAKMQSLSTEYFDDAVQDSNIVIENIKDYKSVPYIILNSIDRDLEKTVNKPEITGGYAETKPANFVILPMEYSDFELIKEISSGFDTMKLSSLFRFVETSEKYGYSAEIFAQIVLNRLLYPLFILNLFIILGWIAWRCRTPAGVQFKFLWIFLFPFIGIAMHYLYVIGLGLFKLLNYGIIALAGKSASLLAGLILYVLLLIVLSMSFLACRNTSDERK